ncbi:MFS transporter [Mesorhizobium sp. VK23B]|uniref:MFS transporter n=1 Tax=Mesorhizobium dulcispinae TaxID=3072316 RepID=A0ABU4XDU2_9HYPH|nr:MULTISPECIES: MFS transporter [unclassified Mesorhizobium]MDX8465406.1 MFS transporter [Mesorhizobium sp. VK23B]MDX8472950.1 MFS transporter [Mesorhizobium sp. VK23A]
MSAVSGNQLGMAADGGRWRVLSLLCLAVVLSLTTWFSATAILPELKQELALGPGGEAWLTNGVQVGFVIGALAASLVNLPDLVRLSRLMAAASLVAALANASLLLHPGPGGVIAARIVTGAALAGVYPPALKLVATWFARDRGLALGAVIGALTVGSALPHLFRAVSTALDWRPVVAAASLATAIGALLFLLFAREGPYPFGKAVFEPSRIGQVFRERPLLLANLGYLGHMWELYAMWAWLLAYTRAAFEAQAIGSAAAASLSTFFVVASGILGCLLGGYLSDRIGRTATTAGMMIVSGSCALLMGFLFTGPLWLFMLVAVVWGVSVVGDSAQFSAAVTELGDRRFVGTALSVQLGAGFALTVLAIWLTPRFADFIGGWRWAFLLLVPGPVLGASAMLILRRLPVATKMASGKR